MGLLYCNGISSVVYLGGGSFYDPCNVCLAPVHGCVYYVWAETDIVLYKVKIVFLHSHLNI